MRWVVLLLGVVFLAQAVASAARAEAAPVFAAPAEGEHPPKGETGEKAQVNPFAGWVDLTVFTIIIFLILFGLLSKFAWPQIREGLDKREQSIARDKHEAELARREAAEMRQRLEAEMARVNDQIRQMMDKARQDAQRTAAEEVARGKAELQAERERQKRELQIEAEDVLHKASLRAIDLATLMSVKAVRKQLSQEDHRALLNEALEEFRAAARNRRQDIEEARA